MNPEQILEKTKEYSAMISLPRLFALVLIPLTLLLLLLACGSDEEPTARPDSSRSDRSTSAPSSTSEGTTVSPTAVEDRPTVKGTSTYMLDLIPATVQGIFLLDLKTIRENLNRFPGDFDVLKRELSERIDDQLDTGEIEIEQVEEFALPVTIEDYWYWSTVVLKGNFDFARIRAAYEEGNEERRSYGGYDGYTTWRGEIVVLLEDKGMIFSSSEDGVRDLLDILNSGSGSLAEAEAEDNELKRILDELGGSPAVVAFVVKEDSHDEDCPNIGAYGNDNLAGCMGLGSAYSGSDDTKDEVYVDIVALFSSERAAEQAADDSEGINWLMEKWLEDTSEEFAKFIGLDSAEARGVSDVDTDDDLAKGTGTIGLGQPLPTPTPRPTRAPTATSAPAATTIPLPQATPAIEATPFRPQAATQAIKATPSRPQATPAIEATPFRPQGTPSRPQATPQPTPLPRATGGPGAVYLGDGNWAALAGPALSPEFQGDYRLGDENGQVPLDAILQHKWIFESDYYQSLLEKARLNNPTSLTSSGESITLRHACVNRTLNWCRHLEAYFAPNVAARTNGQVRIEFSSFQELGLAGFDTADLLADGTLAMTEIYGGYVSAEFPSLEIQSLWGLWPDDQSLFQAQGDIAPKLDRIVADEMGAQVLFRNWIADGGQFLFSRTEIGTPEDFEGLRIRSFGDMSSDWISGMGGEPRPVAFSEVFTAIERGILDVGVSNANSGYSQRWYQVANYMTGPLYSFPSSINAVNRGVWDSIPADLQQILIEEGAKHELEALRLASVQGSAAVERNTDVGLRLVEFSPEIQAKSLQVARENVIPGWLYRIGYSSVDRRPPAPQAAASRGGPTPQPLWVPPTPTAQERQTLSVRAARAVDIFNRVVGPIVGLRIEADGTVTELR